MPVPAESSSGLPCPSAAPVAKLVLLPLDTCTLYATSYSDHMTLANIARHMPAFKKHAY